MVTTHELRKEIRDAAGLASLSEEQVSEPPRPSNHLTLEELAHVARRLGADEWSGDDVGLGEVSYYVAREVGADRDDLDTKPLRKTELRMVLDELTKRPDTEDHPYADLIGSDDASSREDDRERKAPEDNTVRSAVLQGLAINGPGTAAELGEACSTDWSSVESELPRLYKQCLAGRSKRPGFDDVYTYFLTPFGEQVLNEMYGYVRGGDYPYEHEEMFRMYGSLPERDDEQTDIDTMEL